MTLDHLTELFKWMTIINVGLLVLSVALLVILKDVMKNMHSKMFDIKEEQIPVIAYCYLGMYKLLIIVFNLVPYIALSLMQ